MVEIIPPQASSELRDTGNKIKSNCKNGDIMELHYSDIVITGKVLKKNKFLYINDKAIITESGYIICLIKIVINGKEYNISQYHDQAVERYN